MARDLMTPICCFKLRLDRFADVNRVWTAGVEFAPRRLIGGRRDFTFKLLSNAAIVGVKRRDRREQRLGVGMLG